jgi:hypothetical protein
LHGIAHAAVSIHRMLLLVHLVTLQVLVVR